MNVTGSPFPSYAVALLIPPMPWITATTLTHPNGVPLYVGCREDAWVVTDCSNARAAITDVDVYVLYARIISRDRESTCTSSLEWVSRRSLYEESAVELYEAGTRYTRLRHSPGQAGLSGDWPFLLGRGVDQPEHDGWRRLIGRSLIHGLCLHHIILF
jgi:hypothetical protein